MHCLSLAVLGVFGCLVYIAYNYLFSIIVMLPSKIFHWTPGLSGGGHLA